MVEANVFSDDEDLLGDAITERQDLQMGPTQSTMEAKLLKEAMEESVKVATPSLAPPTKISIGMPSLGNPKIGS